MARAGHNRYVIDVLILAPEEGTRPSKTFIVSLPALPRQGDVVRYRDAGRAKSGYVRSVEFGIDPGSVSVDLTEEPEGPIPVLFHASDGSVFSRRLHAVPRRGDEVAVRPDDSRDLARSRDESVDRVVWEPDGSVSVWLVYGR